MYNPRFPHILKVWRDSKDESGVPIVDDEGNPVRTLVTLQKVVSIDEYSGDPMCDAYGHFVTEEVNEISFGYRNTQKNTRDTGDVQVSDYKIATPMFITPLYPGDELELTDYDRKYRGTVIRKMTYNLGSNIWFNEIKN